MVFRHFACYYYIVSYAFRSYYILHRPFIRMEKNFWQGKLGTYIIA